jgi:phasin
MPSEWKGSDMMDNPKMMMEVPAQVRDLAEKSVNQAEKAFEAFITAANQSVAMIPSPTTEMSKKALSLTEKNMKAAFDHARQLVHAKDMQEAIQIQTEFLKSQYAAATEQLKEMGSSLRSTADEASKTVTIK